ncbi:hypothetical protein KCU78_g2803, partial [Aureobasidium melanogenum]
MSTLHVFAGETEMGPLMAKTSRNLRALFDVDCHFADEFGGLKTFLLALPQQLGQHSGVNVTDQITAIIEHFNISGSIGYFMTDNATYDTGLKVPQRGTLESELLLRHTFSPVDTIEIIGAIGTTGIIDIIVLELFVSQLTPHTVHDDRSRRRSLQSLTTRLVGLAAGLRSRRVGFFPSVASSSGAATKPTYQMHTPEMRIMEFDKGGSAHNPVAIADKRTVTLSNEDQTLDIRPDRLGFPGAPMV